MDVSPSLTDDSPPTSLGRRVPRISKACERCRLRRIKCQPPYPCNACREAGSAACQVRDKPRPQRLAKKPDDTSNIAHTSLKERTRSSIDAELESIYAQLTGKTISLAVDEADTHPDLDLAIPYLSSPSIEPSSISALEMFLRYGLNFCSFITSARLQHLFDRMSISPLSLDPDQKALVSACLACGYCRLLYFPEGSTGAVYVDPADRKDVAWFREAVNVLESWGRASFTSLHALCCLLFYSSLACNPRTTLHIVSWMLSQARELGLHHEQTAMAMQHAPLDRADLLFIQIIFSHYVTVALSPHAPMIRHGEFDTTIFQRSTIGNPLGVFESNSFPVELLLLNTQLLLNLHDPTKQSLSIDWLLQIESNWAKWSRFWVSSPKISGSGATNFFVGLLWDVGRLVARLPTTADERFSVSSLAILVQCASSILSRYQSFYTGQAYNLVWYHQSHIITCAHITLYCFHHYSIDKRGAENNLAIAMHILTLAEPRFGTQILRAKDGILSIATALGLEILGAQLPEVIPATPLGQDHASFEYIFGLFTD